jgi:hypothetical protein
MNYVCKFLLQTHQNKNHEKIVTLSDTLTCNASTYVNDGIIEYQRIQTYATAKNRCGITPRCSFLLSRGSVAVQNRASIVSCPNAENSRSPTYNRKHILNYNTNGWPQFVLQCSKELSFIGIFVLVFSECSYSHFFIIQGVSNRALQLWKLI